MSSWVTIKEKDESLGHKDNNQNVEATLYTSRSLYSLALSNYNNSNDDVNNIHWSKTKESLIEIMNVCTSEIVDKDLIRKEYKSGSHGANYQNLYYLASKLLSKMYEIENNKSKALEFGVLSTVCMIHYKNNEVNLFDDNLLLNVGKLALFHNDLWTSKNVLQIIADKYDESNKASSINYLWQDLSNKIIEKCNNIGEVTSILPLNNHGMEIICHKIKLYIGDKPSDTIIAVIKVFQEFFNSLRNNQCINLLNKLVIEIIESNNINTITGSNISSSELSSDAFMVTDIVDMISDQNNLTVTEVESCVDGSSKNVRKNDTGRSTRSKGISDVPSLVVSSTDDSKDIKNESDFCTADLRELLQLNSCASINNADSYFPSMTAYFNHLNLLHQSVSSNCDFDNLREKQRSSIGSDMKQSKTDTSEQLNKMFQEFHEKIRKFKPNNCLTMATLFITLVSEMSLLYTASTFNNCRNGDVEHIVNILKSTGLMIDSNSTTSTSTGQEEKLGRLIACLWGYIVQSYGNSNQMLSILINSLGFNESLLIAECCLDNIADDTSSNMKNDNNDLYYTSINMILNNLTTMTYFVDGNDDINSIRRLRLLLLYSLPIQSSSFRSNRAVKCNVLTISLWDYLDTMIAKYTSFEFLGLTRWSILNESVVKILKSFYIDNIIIIDLEREYYTINNLEKNTEGVSQWVNKVEALISSTDTEFISILASCSQRYELGSLTKDKNKTLPLLFLQGLYMLITTQEMSIEGTSRKFILSKWLAYIAKLLDGLLHISFGSSTSSSDGTNINLSINVPQHIHIWCDAIISGIYYWLPLDKASLNDLKEFFYDFICDNNDKSNQLDLLFVQISKIISRLTILSKSQIVPENALSQVINILVTVLKLAYMLIESIDKKHTEIVSVNFTSESDKFQALLDRIRLNFIETTLYCYKEFSLCGNVAIMDVLVQLSKIIYHLLRHIPNNMKHQLILPSALNIVDTILLVPQCNNVVKVSDNPIIANVLMNAIYYILEYICQNTVQFGSTNYSGIHNDATNVLSFDDFINILSNLHEIITENALFKYHNGKLNKILLDRLMSTLNVQGNEFYDCYDQLTQRVNVKNNVGVYLEIIGQMYYYLYQLPLINTTENFSLNINKIWDSKNDVIRMYNLIKLCEIYNGFLDDTKDCICSRSDIKNALSHIYCKCPYLHLTIKTPAHFIILNYLNDPTSNDYCDSTGFMNKLRNLHYKSFFTTNIRTADDVLWERFLQDFYHHLLVVGGLTDQCYCINLENNEQDKFKLKYTRVISLCLCDLSYYPLRYQTWITFFEHCIVLLYYYNDLLTELSFPDTLPNELDHITYESLLNSLELDSFTGKSNFSDDAITLVRTLLNHMSSDKISKMVSPISKTLESNSSKIFCDILMKKNSLVMLLSKLMNIIDSFKLAQISEGIVSTNSISDNKKINVDESLEKGTIVACNWKNTGNYYTGVIVGKRLAVTNDTRHLIYDILYDDREYERGIESHRCKSYNITAMCYESYATCMYILAQGYENKNKRHYYYLHRSKCYYDKAIEILEVSKSQLPSFLYYMTGKLTYSISSSVTKHHHEELNLCNGTTSLSNVFAANLKFLSITLNHLNRAYDIEFSKIQGNERNLSSLVSIAYSIHSIRIKSILSYLARLLDKHNSDLFSVQQFIKLLDKSIVNFDRGKNNYAIMRCKDLFYDFDNQIWTINRHEGTGIDCKNSDKSGYIVDDLWRHLILSLMVLDDCVKLSPSDFKCIYRIAKTQHFLFKWYSSSSNKLNAPYWTYNIMTNNSLIRDILDSPVIAIKSFFKLFEKKKQQIVAIWCLETASSPYDKILQRTAKFDKLRRKYILSYIHMCTSTFHIYLAKYKEYNIEVISFLTNLYINLSVAHHEVYNKKLNVVCEIPINKEVPNITLLELTNCFRSFLQSFGMHDRCISIGTFSELLKQVYSLHLHTNKMNKIIYDNNIHALNQILVDLQLLIMNNRIICNRSDVPNDLGSDDKVIDDVSGNPLSLVEIRSKLNVFINSRTVASGDGPDIFAITKLCMLLYGSNFSNRNSLSNNSNSSLLKRKRNDKTQNSHNGLKLNKPEDESNTEDMQVII